MSSQSILQMSKLNRQYIHPKRFCVTNCDQGTSNGDGRSPPQPDTIDARRYMPSPESYQLLLAAAAACEDKKAEDIRILALDPAESGLTDYFLICNGTNDRQNVAITDEVELRLKREFGTLPNSV